jgi:UDP-N-acetyl-D-glucosamine dehydrogenase
MFKKLEKKIKDKTASVAIIGLGYVGLPLAIAFARKGFNVFGYDKNKKRIQYLKAAKRYITDVDPMEVADLIKKNRLIVSQKASVLKKSDIIVICVPTPLRKTKVPNISYIIQASRSIANFLRAGQLIILESTTYPGTSREVILPILEKSNLRAGEDFFLCFSPERIDPGNKKFPLTKIPKIVGGINEKSTLLGRLFYSKIIEKVISVSSIESAELVKLLENSFRLINIGLINEFAIVCNKLKVDVWEIIEAARTKPFGFMPFYPGPGIGGHCIPADPLYLSWKAKKLGFKTKMIDLASYTNRFMPRYVADRVEQLLRKKNIPIEKARLLILGVTYKKDILDLRESPAIDIIELLQNKGVKLNYHDPLIPYLRINRINLKRVSLTKDRLKSYDCIVLVTNHSGLDYKFIKNHARLIFDTRNVYKTRAKNIIKL